MLSSLKAVNPIRRTIIIERPADLFQTYTQTREGRTPTSSSNFSSSHVSFSRFPNCILKQSSFRVMEIAEPAGRGKRREAAEFPMSTEPQLTRDRKIAAEPRRGPATLRNTEKISPCLSNTECCRDNDSLISGSDIKQPDKELTLVEEKKARELEVEEFLSAAAETNDMERFTAKYNYDGVNDEPLVGRYE